MSEDPKLAIAGGSWNSSDKDVYSKTASWFRENPPHRIGLRRDARPPNLTVSLASR
jgi:hypothetical protein